MGLFSVHLFDSWCSLRTLKQNAGKPFHVELHYRRTCDRLVLAWVLKIFTLLGVHGASSTIKHNNGDSSIDFSKLPRMITNIKIFRPLERSVRYDYYGVSLIYESMCLYLYDIQKPLCLDHSTRYLFGFGKVEVEQFFHFFVFLRLWRNSIRIQSTLLESEIVPKYSG